MKKKKKKEKKKGKQKKQISDKLKAYINKYKKYLTSYTSVKTSLNKIIKHNESIMKINEAVINVNKILIHTYQFIKLYYLHKYHNNEQLPNIDNKFINTVMKILCVRDSRGSKPNEETKELRRDLELFYMSNYIQLMEPESLIYTHLNTVLDYEAKSVETCFKNHISEHYIKFLNRYINVLVNKNINLKYIKEANCATSLKQIMKKHYIDELNKLKNDILKNTNKCNNYTSIKTYIRENIIPVKDNIEKHIEENPLFFLPSLIKMSIEIEKKDQKIFSCFPLRKNIIPKYIKLDTTTIIHLLFPNGINRAFYLNKGNTKLLEDDIWDMIFNTKKKVFRDKHYKFNHQITTDGIACSLLFIRNDLYDHLKVVKIHSMKKPYNYKPEKYVDELEQEEKYQLTTFNVIGIDPGKEDLIYATNGDTKIINNKHKTTTFRYSQNQRRKETKSKKYMKIIDKDKKEEVPLKHQINVGDFLGLIGINGYNYVNKSVKEIETELSLYNSKSCLLNNVKEYIKTKNTTNNILYNYYAKKLYRKLKWNSFINRQKSESEMLNNFKQIFGNGNKSIICIGDYDNHHMKNKEPVKGKSFRKLFRKAGYNVFLVDEYNTSKTSFLDGKLTEKFRWRKNPRPFRSNIKEIHGLLRFKNVQDNKSCKEILVNRDFNGAMNILKKAKCLLNNIKVPKNLQRQ